MANTKAFLMVALLVISLVGDIKEYKIRNRITLPIILAGVILNTASGALAGFFESLCGMLLPFLLLLMLYVARMLGAGDIKLFCAIGALMGWRYVLWDMAFAFLSGGVIAAIVISTQKNGLSRFRYLASYLKCCFLSLSILPYSDFSEKNNGTSMRFSYGIVSGTILLETLNYLHRI